MVPTMAVNDELLEVISTRAATAFVLDQYFKSHADETLQKENICGFQTKHNVSEYENRLSPFNPRLRFDFVFYYRPLQPDLQGLEFPLHGEDIPDLSIARRNRDTPTRIFSMTRRCLA